MTSKSSIAVTATTRERLRKLADDHFPGKSLNDVLALVLDDFEYHREQVRRRYLANESLMQELWRRQDEADKTGWLSTEDIVAHLAERMENERPTP